MQKLKLELNIGYVGLPEIYRIFETTGKLLTDYPEIWESGYFTKKLLSKGEEVGEVTISYESQGE